MNEPTSPNETETKIAALKQRRAEILANEQDWMREDRAAQIDKEIRDLQKSEVESSK
ncbi:MAG: hypothetical protein V7609_2086 [Verrucomicrobiota bacterium]